MTNIPSFCDNCGNVFLMGGIESGPGTNITFSGSITTCPNCRQPARIMDGTFRQKANGVLEILAAPEHSLRDLERLRDILEAARRQQASPVDVQRQVEEELPGLADWSKKIGEISGSQWMALVVVMIGLTDTLIQNRQRPGASHIENQNITIEQVIEQAPAPPPAALDPDSVEADTLDDSSAPRNRAERGRAERNKRKD